MELVRADKLVPLDVPGGGNCLYHCFAWHLGQHYTVEGLRHLVRENAHLVKEENDDEELAQEVKDAAICGLNAMDRGEDIPRDAWGGSGSSHILARKLNVCVITYDETSGQKWAHNISSQGGQTVRLLFLNWGHYMVLRPEG